MKRKYELKKPRHLTHPQNRIKPFEERMVQGFYSVKGKYKKEADKVISELVKKWK